jgi:hypothetical protein
MDSQCPTLSVRLTRMKSKRITLEAELEAMAGEWGPLRCLETAAKMERWARQLRLKARITLRDRFWGKPQPSLITLPRRKAVLN